MSIVEEIRRFVEGECKKPTSHYGYELFPAHFVPMATYAETLADQLGADREIVSISAWLHDIGSIVHGREDHHITGCEIAQAFLSQINYPQERIDLVKNCILHHRGSQNFEQQSLEEKIIVEADVMSNFDNIAGIFKAAFVYEHLTQPEAKKSAREKLQRKRKQLHRESSKDIVRPKYEAAMLLL